MIYLLPETEANARRFAHDLLAELTTTHSELAQVETGYIAGYRAVVSLQAWREFYFGPRQPECATEFLLECQNDALQSVALSLLGMWRPALQSLRSALEGCLNAAYYADHPVEARLWGVGKFDTTFSGLIRYFEDHPMQVYTPPRLNPLPAFRKEYKELSHAVHASRVSFRMSKEGQISLSRNDGALRSMWLTRHRKTLVAMNLLLCGLYREQIAAPAYVNLRKAVSLVIPDRLRAAMGATWGVRLYAARA